MRRTNVGAGTEARVLIDIEFTSNNLIASPKAALTHEARQLVRVYKRSSTETHLKRTSLRDYTARPMPGGETR